MISLLPPWVYCMIRGEKEEQIFLGAEWFRGRSDLHDGWPRFGRCPRDHPGSVTHIVWFEPSISWRHACYLWIFFLIPPLIHGGGRGIFYRMILSFFSLCVITPTADLVVRAFYKGIYLHCLWGLCFFGSCLVSSVWSIACLTKNGDLCHWFCCELSCRSYFNVLMSNWALWALQ